MYRVEFHDDEVDNARGGTLAGALGRDGNLHHAYQAEIGIKDALPRKDWRRAYLLGDGRVKAVWERDPSTDSIRYLARDPDYTGTWELPFVGDANALIAVGMWGQCADSTEDAALMWATCQLYGKVATAIILGDGEIRFAWELVDGKPQLITRGPQR